MIAIDDLKITDAFFLPLDESPTQELKRRYPYRVLKEEELPLYQEAIQWITGASTQKPPLQLQGTPFQLEVWEALAKIPRGETKSYQEIALSIGRDKALRAVGTAIGKNPIAVLIPCHRVLPKDKSLGRYHWGSDLKRQLLMLEGTKPK